MVCDINETDPFEKVYNALWALVERNPYFNATQLKLGNRIKFDKETSYKVNIADADTPELQLILGPISELTSSCNLRGCTKTYTWGLATGQNRRAIHNKISFELFRSMTDFEEVLHPLTWCSCTFVIDVKIVAEDIGRQMQDLNREIDGWSSLLAIEVKFSFPLSKLRVVDPAQENITMVCPTPRTSRFAFVGDYTGAVLTRFQRVRNARLDVNANPEMRIYAGTRFGVQRITGGIDYTGSFGGFGAVPPLFVGDKFTYFTYIAPTSGIPCTEGCAYHVPAIVTSLSINWNWTYDNKRVTWDIEFASLGLLTQVPDFDDDCDDAVYCDDNLCSYCPIFKDCSDVLLEFCNIVSATLTFNANAIEYSNCTTSCGKRREPGHLDWTLDIVDQNPCVVPVGQMDYDIQLPATASTNWRLKWGKYVGVTDYMLDMENDAIIGKTNRFMMQAINCCVPGSPVRGSIVNPAGTTLWPYPDPV